MNSVTLHEVLGGSSHFPSQLREALCNAVGDISADDMEELLSRHESDPMNFDGKIEENLRLANESLNITRDSRIASETKFNIDLVIEADGILVLLEIEKGYLARFEFDLLKMLAFCSNRIDEQKPPTPICGAFIVPNDNVVARHISGNARESSYKYLTRLSRLFAQIRPSCLEDVLIVGYGLKEPVPESGKKGKARGKTSNVVVEADGLLADEQLVALRRFPSELWKYFRQQLISKCPNLKEKFNSGSKYLGYKTGKSYPVYVYIQKQRLVLDLRLAEDRTDEIVSHGFDVRPKNNYQARQGWLTGLRVPHDTEKRDEIVALLLEALEVEGPP